MNRISCIIFDMDGTLTRTNELIYASFNHVADKYEGKVYTPTEITAMFGPPEEGALAKIVGKEQLDDAMDDFVAFYEKHHPAMAGAYDGIVNILRFLKDRNVILAVFTGKGSRTTVVTLEKLGIKEYFDFIVTGNDVVNHKPSSEGIRKVLTKFGLPPEQALMVGDSVSDVKAAHEAGVKIAAVLWDSYSKEKVLGMDVDYFFHSVEEFERWLRNHYAPADPLPTGQV
jgi:HAD superfamily hydrolase (TIGR01509 family)